MARVYTLSNHKGGCAKTSSAVAFSSMLGSLGFRVLLVDMDPQGNATQWAGVDVAGKASMLDVLSGACPTEQAVVACERYDILPGEFALSNLDEAIGKIEACEENNRMLVEVGLLTPEAARFATDAMKRETGVTTAVEGGMWRRLLSDRLSEVEEDYDIIIVDTPPNLGHFTVMSLVAARDGVLVPTDCSTFSKDAMLNLAEIVRGVREIGNPDCRIVGFLITRADKRTKAYKATLEQTAEMSESLGAPFLGTVRNTAAVVTAQNLGCDIFDTRRTGSTIPNNDYGEIVTLFLESQGIEVGGQGGSR